MSWWARSRLRSKIFCAFSALILVVSLAVLGFTQFIVSQQVQATLRQELLTTGQVFQGLLQEQAERLRTNAALLAGDFALKKVVAPASDYDPETLASAALNYQQRIGVDLLWMTDENGTLRADANAKKTSGTSVATLSPLAEALQSGEATTAITAIEGKLFQLVAVPVLGPDVIGFLVLGEEINDALAQQLEKDTGSRVTFLSHAQLFAASWGPLDRERLFPDGHIPAMLWDSQPNTTMLLHLASERFLSLLVPIAAHLPTPLFALVQRSYDTALAPFYDLRRRILGVGAGAILLALAVSIGLANGITTPIQGLVTSMHEILRGNFQQRLRVNRQDEIGFLADSFNEMAAGLEKGEQIKDTFGRFVSHDVAEAVLNGHIPLAGERREVTILFQDIRGFTSISEKLDPAELLRVLNQFFTEVVAAVEAEDGVVKQFTGDGAMVLFGAPVAHDDDPARAVRAALGIVHRLASLNARLRAQNGPLLRIGVGIHTGEVVAGRIGPDERVEYGVVGDPVNLASRIEGLTKEMQATLLVSQITAAKLGPGFTLGRSAALAVKGKEKPIEVVEVLAYEPVVEESHDESPSLIVSPSLTDH